MNPKIIENDVFLYHCNRLSPERRRAVEDAVQMDQQVRAWFREHAPADKPVTIPSIDLADPKTARIAAIALEIVAGEEEANRWTEWASQPTSALPSPALEANCLFQTPNGMVYCNEVPAHLSFDSTTFVIPPVICPCVEPDYTRKYLTIRQPLKALEATGGRIEIVAVRFRKDVEPTVCPPKGRQLERGDEYWYDDIPLADILPDGWKPGDVFVYVVPAAYPRNTKTGE